MGWKNVKEHYRIVHSVCVTDEGICIGSQYIHNIIVIGLDGVIKKRDDSRCNAELTRYMRELDSDPIAYLKQLVLAPDTFSKSVTVFTYDGAEIIERQCEVPGWPNVTHDGQMMYENTFSTDRSQVVKWALQNAEAGVSLATDRVREKKLELEEAEKWLAESQAYVSALAAM